MKFSNAFAALCAIAMSTKQGGGLFRSAGAVVVEPPTEAELAFRAKHGGDKLVDSTKESSLLRGGSGGGGERKLEAAMTLANLLLKPAGPGVIQPTIVAATTQGTYSCSQLTSNGFFLSSGYGGGTGYPPLQPLLGNPTYDHCGLQIQFQCPQPKAEISIGFTFSTNEGPPPTAWNDGFGAFLNGGLIGLRSVNTPASSPFVGLTQPGINTLQLSVVDTYDSLFETKVDLYKGTLECKCPTTPSVTTFHVWDPVSDTELFQLQNNSAVCINSTSYNIEARYYCNEVPQTQVKLSLANSCNATTRNSGTQTELVAPYFVYGDEPNSGDVFRNPKSKTLINCAWSLSAKADNRPVEKIFFTQSC